MSREPGLLTVRSCDDKAERNLAARSPRPQAKAGKNTHRLPFSVPQPSLLSCFVIVYSVTWLGISTTFVTSYLNIFASTKSFWQRKMDNMDNRPIDRLDELEKHLQVLKDATETPFDAKLFDDVELQLTREWAF
jgi:hypothetical protein